MKPRRTKIEVWGKRTQEAKETQTNKGETENTPRGKRDNRQNERGKDEPQVKRRNKATQHKERTPSK